MSDVPSSSTPPAPPLVRLDHFLTFTSASTIEAQLARCEALGFLVHPRTVRHDPGLRNGFVALGPEYLEFLWVEDEAKFAAAPPEDREARTPPRPFGIGIAAADVAAVHDAWVGRGYAVPDVFSKADADAAADAPPLWTFLAIPKALLPGAETFLLQYRARRTSSTQVRPAPNSIYGVAGVTFVADDPLSRATRWRDVLAPGASVEGTDTWCGVDIAAHRATWMTPGCFDSWYGKAWAPAPHDHGEIALLHLVAGDLATVHACMSAGGRTVRDVAGGLLVEPDPVDGFAFLVSQADPHEWIRKRAAVTGETLVAAIE